MNIKRYYFGIVGLSVLFAGLFSSCSDDFFDTKTDDRISPDKHYNSMVDAELSTLGCFILLQDVAENLVLVDGLQSDQLNVTENADYDMISLSRHEVAGMNAYLDASNYYKVILNVNEVLPNLQQIIGKDRDFDSISYEGYRGQLITLRSWAYYTMFKLYGKVSFMSTDVKNIDFSQPPVYITDKNVLIDTLIAQMMPFYDSLDRNRFVIDHYALMGEMLLDKGDYAAAADLLKYSIDGPAYDGTGLRGQFMMITTRFQKANWQQIFIDAESQGLTVRTAVPYDISSGHKNNIEEWMNYDFNYMVKPTSCVLDSFNTELPLRASDPIGDLYRGVSISFDTTAAGETYVNKYSLPATYAHCADIILYRDADLHLMLAEALNRSGQTSTALSLLNDGIKNAKPKPSGYTKWSGNIGVRGRVALQNKTVPSTINPGTAAYIDYVEDMIIQERAQELAFEGKRWFDLVRIAERRGDPAYLADRVAAKFGAVGSSEYNYMHSKLMDPSTWYLPY